MIGAGCGIGEHNLSQHSVKWCEKSGLKAQQACQGAPWVIEAEALAAIKIGPRGRPVTSNLDQQTLQF